VAAQLSTSEAAVTNGFAVCVSGAVRKTNLSIHVFRDMSLDSKTCIATPNRPVSATCWSCCLAPVSSGGGHSTPNCTTARSMAFSRSVRVAVSIAASVCIAAIGANVHPATPHGQTKAGISSRLLFLIFVCVPSISSMRKRPWSGSKSPTMTPCLPFQCRAPPSPWIFT
jgi:hypothetical protein